MVTFTQRVLKGHEDTSGNVDSLKTLLVKVPESFNLKISRGGFFPPMLFFSIQALFCWLYSSDCTRDCNVLCWHCLLFSKAFTWVTTSFWVWSASVGSHRKTLLVDSWFKKTKNISRTVRTLCPTWIWCHLHTSSFSHLLILHGACTPVYLRLVPSHTKGGFKPNVVFDPGSTSVTGGLAWITS